MPNSKNKFECFYGSDAYSFDADTFLFRANEAQNGATVTFLSPNENESKKCSEDDPVNHPTHYTSHPSGVECIDIAKWYDFCIGNCIKYIWRAGLKSENGMTDKEKKLQDLKKAQWYLNKEIEELEKK